MICRSVFGAPPLLPPVCLSILMLPPLLPPVCHVSLVGVDKGVEEVAVGMEGQRGCAVRTPAIGRVVPAKTAICQATGRVANAIIAVCQATAGGW